MYIDNIRYTIHDTISLDNEINRIKNIIGYPITIFYNTDEYTAIMLYFDKAIYVGKEKSKSYNQVDYVWLYKLKELDR